MARSFLRPSYIVQVTLYFPLIYIYSWKYVIYLRKMGNSAGGSRSLLLCYYYSIECGNIYINFQIAAADQMYRFTNIRPNVIPIPRSTRAAAASPIITVSRHSLKPGTWPPWRQRPPTVQQFEVSNDNVKSLPLRPILRPGSPSHAHEFGAAIAAYGWGSRR